MEAFTHELARLEAAGALQLSAEQRAAIAANQQSMLAEWRERFDIDVGRGQRQLSWGVKVAAFLAALALGMGVFLLLWRLWRHLNEGEQVMLPLLAACLFTVTCGLFAAREKSVLFARLFGVLACVCFGLDVALLGHMFNMPASPGFFLLLGLFALALTLAVTSRLLLAVAVGALAEFVAASVMQLAGFAWGEFMHWPETFLPAAALLAAAAWAMQRRGSELAPAARFVTLLVWFVPALFVGFNGWYSFLPWDREAVEMFWQFVTGISVALLVALGVRRGWAETVYASAFFGTLLLIIKFFEWWWDALPKELFFLLVGLLAVLAVLVLRRLRASVGQSAAKGQGAQRGAAAWRGLPWLAQRGCSAQAQRAALGTAAALALLVIGNGAALMKMRANASQVQAQLQLSARELWVYEHKDIAGRSTTTRLRARETCDWGASKDGWVCTHSSPWLTADKMRALGFGADVGRERPRMPARPVWLVLELAGDAWQQEVASRQRLVQQCLRRQQQAPDETARRDAQTCQKNAEKRLHEAQEEDSRLFIVDAGRSVEELRGRWPDAARYAIAPGSVRWDSQHPGVDLRKDGLYVPRRFAAAAQAVSKGQEMQRKRRYNEDAPAVDMSQLSAPLLRFGAHGLAWIAAWEPAADSREERE